MDTNKKKYRLFGLVPVVDILILIGIAILVWGALQFSAPQTVSAKPGDVTVRYTVELSKKEAGFHEKVEIGAKLFDGVKNYEIGVIKEVYALPYRQDTSDEANNIIRRAPVEGLEFVYIVLEATAQISDSATSIGQYDIMVEKEVWVKSRSFAGQGYIVAIERLG